MAKITIRIHRQHDMDLMSIYRNKSYHIAKEIKKALIAYANDAVYVPTEVDVNNEIDGYVPTSAIVHITLSEKKDDERKALELLSHIKYGYRCSFIKAVFRSSLPYLPLLAYSDNSGFVMAKSKAPIRVAMDSFNDANTKEEALEPLNEAIVPKQISKPEPITETNDTKAAELGAVSSDDTDLDALFSQMDKLGR